MAARPRGPYRQTPNSDIRGEQAETLRAAAAFAARRGWRLDRMITLNFYFTDCEPERMPKAFEYIRDMAVRWYRYEAKVGRVAAGDALAFVWVLEHVGDYYHAHWLIHLPRGSEERFIKKLMRWTLRAAGVAQERYLHIRDADGGAIHYLTKGTDPAHFVGNPRWRSSSGAHGYFRSKRCGISANLAATSPARR